MTLGSFKPRIFYPIIKNLLNHVNIIAVFWDWRSNNNWDTLMIFWRKKITSEFHEVGASQRTLHPWLTKKYENTESEKHKMKQFYLSEMEGLWIGADLSKWTSLHHNMLFWDLSQRVLRLILAQYFFQWNKTVFKSHLKWNICDPWFR